MSGRPEDVHGVCPSIGSAITTSRPGAQLGERRGASLAGNMQDISVGVGRTADQLGAARVQQPPQLLFAGLRLENDDGIGARRDRCRAEGAISGVGLGEIANHARGQHDDGQLRGHQHRDRRAAAANATQRRDRRRQRAFRKRRLDPLAKAASSSPPPGANKRDIRRPAGARREAAPGNARIRSNASRRARDRPRRAGRSHTTAAALRPRRGGYRWSGRSSRAPTASPRRRRK